MANNFEIKIAEEFSRRLGARYKYEGKFSGEKFLEDHLLPGFLKAKESGGKLIIYLDGVLGYPSSFVSGSFGKLSIDYGADTVLQFLELISSNPLRIEKIVLEIKNPKTKPSSN
jgi:hypothetical protein